MGYLAAELVLCHLNHGNEIHDHVYNDSFHIELESYQYYAALAIAEAISGSSREKLYQELDLETL